MDSRTQSSTKATTVLVTRLTTHCLLQGRCMVSAASLAITCLASTGHAQTPADLQTLAKSYYTWRDSKYPVATSDLTNHRWYERLAYFRVASIGANRRA